jgi:hypothetical protein
MRKREGFRSPVREYRTPGSLAVMDGEKSMDFIHPTVGHIADFIPNAKRKTVAGQTHQAAPEAVAPLLIEFFGEGR